MGCASSKTAEDKEEMAKRKSGKGGKSSTSAAATTASLQNGKASASAANNISGSVANNTAANGTSPASQLQQKQQQQQQANGNSQTNLQSKAAQPNSYITTNPNNPNLNSSETNSNNLLLLIEFFKAVGNGELERLKQILANLDEITAKNRIRMTRAELLNEGMADADGLTALSIAAGRKHKELTEFLADLPEVDVNKASESGITPLLMVAEVGWTDVMRKLLKRGNLFFGEDCFSKSR
jgi:hypothetical protein